MTGVHQKHLLTNVKDVFLKLAWEAGNLKFFSQPFQEGLQQVVRMHNW